MTSFNRQLDFWTHMLDEAYGGMLTEGDHWPEDFIKRGANQIKASTLGSSGQYSDLDIANDLASMAKKYKQHELAHTSKQMNMFKTVVKWMIEYSNGSIQKKNEFKNTKFDQIIENLQLIFSNQELIQADYDNIRNRMSFAQFEEYCQKMNDALDISQKSKMANFAKEDKGYQLIEIDSYEQLHEMFGGQATGAGQDTSGWCHTNGEDTYDIWTKNGKAKFFILCKKNWKQIAPQYKDAMDEYGSSAIALLVSINSGKLIANTFRYNHVMEPNEQMGKVDHCVEGYAQLSEIAGFDVQAEIEKMLVDDRARLPSSEKILNAAYDGFDLNVFHNEDLTSLKGCPSRIVHDFNISYTPVDSLVGGPEHVGGMYVASHTEIDSLEGFPSHVGGSIYLESTHLKNLAGVQPVVNGDFNVSFCNDLTSLNGAPQIVHGEFSCEACMDLNDLSHFPIKADRFWIRNIRHLTSLYGMPDEVYGNFDCSYCLNIKTLDGASQVVHGNFVCENLPIATLEGAPLEVDGDFNCSNCYQLTSLVGAPARIGGKFVCMSPQITTKMKQDYRKFLKRPSSNHLDSTGHYKP